MRPPAGRLVAWSAMLTLAGCSTLHYDVNPALTIVQPDEGYRLRRVMATDPTDHLFLQVGISGGGARAAALGFGVLEELRDTPVHWEGKDERLIDELDVLMGVSGGSMLTAAIALDGPEGLDRFETTFLNARLESDFEGQLLRPSSLWHLSSRDYGRGDAFEAFLDERLYRGATFAELSRHPRKPFGVIYATDMVTGHRFQFVQDQFDFLCSDLDGVKLARAVAASSAVPLVLSPITLWNHAADQAPATCGTPAVLEAAPQGGSAQASHRLAEQESYREMGPTGLRRPYIHLIDGGLSDNVNVRGAADYIGQFGTLSQGLDYVGYRGIRRMVFIVVNAETSARSPEDTSPHVPGPLRTALALADIPINRNSATALARMRATLEAWRAEAREAIARGDTRIFAPDIQFYLIEIDLTDPADPGHSERLQAIPTSLQLSPEEVQLLRAHARNRLRTSPDFIRLKSQLG